MKKHIHKNNKILALDFDGVLWRSARENWEIGYITYSLFSSSLAYDKKNHARFMRARHLARSGDDFYYIFKLLDEHPKIDAARISEKKWRNFKIKHSADAKIFTEKFYIARKFFQQNNYKYWVKLQTPYPGVIQEIEKIKKHFKHIYITSAKDGNSIKLLLKKHNLPFKVLSREHSIHKYEQIKTLKKKHRARHWNIYFIDDCLENLTPLKNSGVNIFMAEWGYNSAQCRREAKKMGIPVIKIKNMGKQLGVVRAENGEQRTEDR